ncbi:MAG: hypothetical protein ACUVRM_00125 [Bacillota bacterium]
MPRARSVLLAFALAFACLLRGGSPACGAEASFTLEVLPAADYLGPLILRLDGDDLDLDSFYLRGRLWGYAWRAGVVPVDWGPSPAEDLLFSGRHGLLSVWAMADYRGFEILPALHYENFYARLAPRDGSDRYLIGRRYTFGGQNWRAGFIETVLLSGDFSPYYLLPYPFFPLSVGKVFLTACGVGDPKDANLLYGLDLTWQGERSKAYIALLIDEAPLTSAWEGPWRVGLQLGGQRQGIFGRPELSFWAEYTALSRYVFTYHEGYARGDYCDGDELLGHPLGPDADLLRLRLTKKEKGGRSFWAELTRERHGEGGFGDRWDPSAGQILEFLTGTVETAWGIGLGFNLPLGEEGCLGLTLSSALVENLDHHAGETGGRNRVELVFRVAI